jgi:hypothetical protein
MSNGRCLLMMTQSCCLHACSFYYRMAFQIPVETLPCPILRTFLKKCFEYLTIGHSIVSQSEESCNGRRQTHLAIHSPARVPLACLSHGRGWTGALASKSRSTIQPILVRQPKRPLVHSNCSTCVVATTTTTTTTNIHILLLSPRKLCYRRINRCFY